MLRILSLGAGVQSTTVAFMAAKGEIGPMPDCGIFADTGWEPARVYQHLDWMIPQLPYPVYRVSNGSLRDDIITKAKSPRQGFASVPWYLKMPNGDAAMGRRQCTKEYKLVPIRRKVRELLGGRTPKGGAEIWIGISTDEASRMKPSQAKYMVNRWPLIELGMSRRDCLRWMAKNGYPEPAKSSCIGCPFHNDNAWREMRDQDPVSWADAVALDKAIRSGGTTMRGEQYMHRSLVPLDQVDLSTAEDRGQINMFNNECEGMCGV